MKLLYAKYEKSNKNTCLYDQDTSPSRKKHAPALYFFEQRELFLRVLL